MAIELYSFEREPKNLTNRSVQRNRGEGSMYNVDQMSALCIAAIGEAAS